MEAGLFDPMTSQIYPTMDSELSNQPDSDEAARDAIILLQNNHSLLPFAKGKRTVLIGPFAGAR
jgi:hypothetical protein